MLGKSDFIGLGRNLDISIYLNMDPSPPAHTASWFECTVQSRMSNFTPWTWTSLPMSFILHALPWRVVQMHAQLGLVDDGNPLVPSKNMSWIDQNAITMFQPWLYITITKKQKNGSTYIKNKFIDFYRFIYTQIRLLPCMSSKIWNTVLANTKVSHPKGVIFLPALIFFF